MCLLLSKYITMKKITLETLPQAVLNLSSKLDRIESLLMEKSDSSKESGILNIEGVAELLGLSVQTIYGYVAENSIPFYKPKKRLYFLKGEIVFWMQEHKEKSVSELEKDALDELSNLKK